MNLGLNKVEGTLVHDALTYFFKSTQCPKALLECYPGADLADIMNQLQYIMLLGEDPNEYAEILKLKKGE